MHHHRVESRASSSESVEHTTTAAPLSTARSTSRWMSAFDPTSTPCVGSSSTSTFGATRSHRGDDDLLLVAARQSCVMAISVLPGPDRQLVDPLA